MQLATQVQCMLLCSIHRCLVLNSAYCSTCTIIMSMAFMPCVQPAACWIMIKGITQTACRSSACHSLVKATHSADGHGGSKPQAALCARVSIICIHVVEQTHHCSLDRQQQQTLSDLPHLGSDTHESSSTCVIAIVTVHTECDRLHAMRLFPPTTCKYAAVCACSPDIHWQMALQLSHC